MKMPSLLPIQFHFLFRTHFLRWLKKCQKNTSIAFEFVLLLLNYCGSNNGPGIAIALLQKLHRNFIGPEIAIALLGKLHRFLESDTETNLHLDVGWRGWAPTIYIL